MLNPNSLRLSYTAHNKFYTRQIALSFPLPTLSKFNIKFSIILLFLLLRSPAQNYNFLFAYFLLNDFYGTSNLQLFVFKVSAPMNDRLSLSFHLNITWKNITLQQKELFGRLDRILSTQF